MFNHKMAHLHNSTSFPFPIPILFFTMYCLWKHSCPRLCQPHSHTHWKVVREHYPGGADSTDVFIEFQGLSLHGIYVFCLSIFFIPPHLTFLDTVCTTCLSMASRALFYSILVNIWHIEKWHTRWLLIVS